MKKSSLTNPENPIMEVKSGDVEFRNVSFKYSKHAEKDALSNINLKIKSGQTIWYYLVKLVLLKLLLLI